MSARSYLIGLILLGVGISTALAEDIYSYVDNEGGVHFSNFPNDARFKRIPGLSSTDTPILNATNKNIPNHAYSPIIKSTADLYQIDEALLHAVIKTESGYNPNAVSPKGAVGLMQLMPATAKRYGVVNAKDPAENIQAGARYMQNLMNKFSNNLELALAAYNAGEAAIQRHGNVLPPYIETQNYVPQVMKRYQLFSGCATYQCKKPD